MSMKVSISNIAWKAEDDEAVYALIKKYGYEGIDIAPSRIWNDIYAVAQNDSASFCEILASKGLVVGGMQSLLFNRPDLTIFENEPAREATGEALKRMIDLGSAVGASAVIFGSPKNRIIGDDRNTKVGIAIDFFRQLGEYAFAKNISFCIEPNPTIYGGDFLTHTEETFDFVEQAASQGLKVNLDMGTVIANNEDMSIEYIQEKIDLIGHVHVSMPFLKPVVITDVHHKTLDALVHAGYSGWISIEMACIDGSDRLVVIEKAMQDVAMATREAFAH